MNLLVHLLSEAWARRLGWVLIHFLWEGTIIALVLAVLLRLFTKASSQTRYALAGMALLICAIAPAITWTMLAPHEGGSSPVTEVGPVNLPQFQDGMASASIALPAGLQAPIEPQTPWQARLVYAANASLPWAVGLWFVGIIILSTRLTLGWIWMKRLCRSSIPARDPRCLEKLEGLLTRMQIDRPVRLLESALVEVPTLIGWLRPSILLPVALFAGLTPDQLEAIFAHELAHVRRHDYLLNLLQTIIETTLFYHPAVWWISRKLREERENCCDDLALEVMADRLVYVSALARLEEGRAMPLALSASGGSLLQRIKRIVGTKDRKTSAWPLWILILGVLSIVCVAKSKANETLNPPITTAARTYLEVTYVKTTDASAMPGLLTIDSGYAKKLTKNPKNKVTKLIDFPLQQGMNNTIKGKTPDGFDYTVTLDWKNSLETQPQDLAIKLEWSNANNAGVSYSFGGDKTSLRKDQCVLIIGPWKTKESSNLLISFVRHPSGQSPTSETGIRPPANSSTETSEVDPDEKIIHNIKFLNIPLTDLAKKLTAMTKANDPKGVGVVIDVKVPPGEAPLKITYGFPPYTDYLEDLLYHLANLYPIRYELQCFSRDPNLQKAPYTIIQLPAAEALFNKKAGQTKIDLDLKDTDLSTALKSVQSLAAAKGFSFELNIDAITGQSPPITLNARGWSVQHAILSLCYLADLVPQPLENFNGYRLVPGSIMELHDRTSVQFGIATASFKANDDKADSQILASLTTPSGEKRLWGSSEVYPPIRPCIAARKFRRPGARFRQLAFITIRTVILPDFSCRSMARLPSRSNSRLPLWTRPISVRQSPFS
jgi:beta-lactamase regulating signal transducer with metallopeptidase domain